MPTNWRMAIESYSASSAAGSDKLHQCYRKCSRNIRSNPIGGRPFPAWDRTARPPRTVRATAPPAPSPPGTPLDVPACYACRNLSSPASIAASPPSSRQFSYGCHRCRVERDLFRPSLEQNLHRSRGTRVEERLQNAALPSSWFGTWPVHGRSDRLIQSDLSFLALSYRRGQRISSPPLRALFVCKEFGR